MFSKETLKKYLTPVFYEELVLAENEPDIFKKLDLPPDEVRGGIRIYNMKPKNDTNFANPLDILYIAAEGTFLRMFKGRGGQGLDRNFIREIKYFENETLAKRFNNSKRRLEQEPASLCIRYPVVSLWEGITMRVGIKRATSLLATTVRLWL